LDDALRADSLAVWRVLRLRRRTPAHRLGLTLCFAQLALNAAWSWMFFAAHNPVLGLINIVPQLLVISATIVVFLRLDRIAVWCLVPLAVWVGFAAVLNFAIWSLNAWSDYRLMLLCDSSRSPSGQGDRRLWLKDSADGACLGWANPP
jgi:TspO/MBR family